MSAANFVRFVTLPHSRMTQTLKKPAKFKIKEKKNRAESATDDEKLTDSLPSYIMVAMGSLIPHNTTNNKAV
jgi:hypothetical protein